MHGGGGEGKGEGGGIKLNGERETGRHDGWRDGDMD